MRAFSLVELSIVLVILGLLTGGILTGQSLIRAAEVRTVSTDLARYQASIYSFRDRYMAMPGDMTNATRFWGSITLDGATCPIGQGTDTHTCDGNGDGILKNTEGFRLWQQLANAGLIEGTYTGIPYESNSSSSLSSLAGYNTPASKLGTNTTFSANAWGPYQADTDIYNFPMEQSNTLRFGTPLCSNGRGSARCPILRPEEAWNIDTKLDDGKPAYGKLRSYKQNSDLTPNCTTSDTAADAGYNLGNNDILCAIYYILN